MLRTVAAKARTPALCKTLLKLLLLRLRQDRPCLVWRLLRQQVALRLALQRQLMLCPA
jgi:hypothetical protein